MTTASERILSAKSGRAARAGDVIVCSVDWVLATDASGPMTIDYFERMGGTTLFDPKRVVFALDHYSPPTAKTKGYHDRVRAFAREFGAEVCDVGEGISHQLLTERGLAREDDLVIGADSHTVTCGALGAFATGVGSSDLAAAMITGQIWLRVPETIQVSFTGSRRAGAAAKDVALAIVSQLTAEGANYQTIEFAGPSTNAFDLDDRLVLSNLAVEAGAKAAIWPSHQDAGAAYARSLTVDLGSIGARVALPHSPDRVVSIEAALDIPIHMVFLGTCTGGRVKDYHEALAVLERGGSKLASGVELVVTPASRTIRDALVADGTLAKLEAMGATVTTVGCGACCGTSGVIPHDGDNVLSTANRNFKARMGNATASIYLASPATCAAAAITGRISDPARIGTP